MSTGYLRRLVDRAAGTDRPGMLRPRLPSLFEPAGPAWGAADGARPGPVAVLPVGPGTAVTARPVGRPEVSPAEPDREPEASVSNPRRLGVWPVPAASAPADPPVRSATPTELHQPPRPVGSAGEAAPEPAAAANGLSRAMGQPEAVGSLASGSPAGAHEALVAMPIAVATADPAAMPRPHRPSARPSTAAASADPAARAAGIGVPVPAAHRPAVSTASTPAAPVPTAPALAAPVPAVPLLVAPFVHSGRTSEPVVHVTIGRIEVRAAAPPVPTEQPAAPPTEPPISLERYLAERERR